MQFIPLKKENVVDYIIDQLKFMILNGVIKVGDRLPSEAELTRLLGVGRGSVREALKSLETLGVLKKNKTGTFISTNVSYSEQFMMGLAINSITFEELLEVRKIIEVGILEFCIIKSTEEDFEAMGKSIVAMKEAIEEKALAKYSQANRDFHTAIVQASRNRVLLDLMIPQIWFKICPTIKTPRAQLSSYKKAMVIHEEIYNAIRNRDLPRATAAMIKHFQNIETIYLEELILKNSDDVVTVMPS